MDAGLSKSIEKKALIFMAAGFSQESLIKRAKEIGFLCIGIDRNPDAPGLKWCDEKICRSTYDFPAIEPLLVDLKEKYNIAGIINRSAGYPVVVSAQIAKKLKLPNVDPAMAKVLVEKDLQRLACRQSGLPIPRFFVTKKSPIGGDPDFPGPYVVKPALSLVGKSGITKVLTTYGLGPAISEARSVSMNGNVLIEEFLSGKDFSLFSLVSDEEVSSVCLMEELNSFDENSRVCARGYRTARQIDKEKYFSRACDIAKKLVEVFQIRRSNLMVSLRVDADDKLQLIEVHLDIGADLIIEEVFPKALNLDYVVATIKNLAGERSLLPSEIELQPTVILYEDGSELIRKKKFKVFNASSDSALDQLIAEYHV